MVYVPYTWHGKVMMTNFRQERIETLLTELRYEVERGMMARDIDEALIFRFYVPVSHRIFDGLVLCEFRTRPIFRSEVYPEDFIEPRLRIIE
jgi:hypothetical protein